MPMPLWDTHTKDRVSLLRPTLLRFSTDKFMDDLAGRLAKKPVDLSTLVARPVSYRLAGPAEDGDPKPTLDYLKLYQPAHGDFYLVAASLVCGIPGLPERTVDLAAGERVSFVLRRLAGTAELAWVSDPTTPKRGNWSRVASSHEAEVAEREELLPLFHLGFAAPDTKRKLFVGFIPTASGESFLAAPTLDPAPTLPSDTRPDELETRVITPLGQLIAHGAGGGAERVEASRFILLELAQFLHDHLRSLWDGIKSGVKPGPGYELQLYLALEQYVADSADPSGGSWLAALRQAWSQRRDITGESGQTPQLSLDLARTAITPDTLRRLVQNAMPGIATATAPAVAPVPIPKLDPGGNARYVIRCVYRRPQCYPPKHDVVSAPTEQFAIAPFFDFDAPARDIQITLPADASIKDLRKFQRNVSILISDELRKKMSRIGPLADLVKGDLKPGESPSLGWICTFSIPIITICALIVLSIFLSLLNLVFWWLPFVRICLPLPLKAK
jgi:hypothetical protein